jgi:hypothetical protein
MRIIVGDMHDYIGQENNKKKKKEKSVCLKYKQACGYEGNIASEIWM